MLVKAAGHEDIAARFRAERAAAAAAKAAENSKAVESTPPPPEKTNKVEHEDKAAFRDGDETTRGKVTRERTREKSKLSNV